MTRAGTPGNSLSRGRGSVALSTNNQLFTGRFCSITGGPCEVFQIPTLVNRRPLQRRTQHHRRRIPRRISTAPVPSTPQRSGELSVLSIYVVNAAGLSKQHAVEHMATDLNSYGVDAAVITETHFGAKHADNIVSVPDCTLFRRDRCTRNASGRLMKGGGVAVYVRSALHSVIWKYSGDDPTLEVLWVRSGGFFIGAVYNPPKLQYQLQSLIDYIDGCVQELLTGFPAARVVIAGDFNKLPEINLVAATGFTPIVHQPWC